MESILASSTPGVLVMKRFFIVLAVILIASPAFGQMERAGNLEFTAGVGMNMPTGDFGEGMNNGLMVGATASYRFIEPLCLGVEINYFHNSANDETLAALGSSSEMETSFTQASVMARYNFPVGFHNVYGKGVIGNYSSNLTIRSSTVDADASDNNVGFGAGAGFVFNGPRAASFYFEGMWHHISGEASDADLFVLGGGIMFSLPLGN